MKTLNEKTLGIRSKIEVDLRKNLCVNSLYQFQGENQLSPAFLPLLILLYVVFHAVVNLDSYIL